MKTCRNSLSTKVTQEDERRFRYLVESISDWIWEVDSNLRFTYASPQITKLLGYSPQEILGKRPIDIMTPIETEKLGPILTDMIAHPRPFQGFINEHLHKDGSVRVLETSAVPVIEHYGQFCGFWGIGRDITESRALAELLRLSEERYRDLAENTTDWVWEIDVELRFSYANPKVTDLLGYSPEEVLGKTPFEFMPPEELTLHRVVRDDLLAHPRPFQGFVHRHIRKDGSFCFLEISAVPIHSHAGQFVGFRGITRDITERKNLESALRSSEERFQLVSQAANDPIYDWNITTGTAWLNQAHQDLFGSSIKSAGSDWWKSRIHPDDQNGILSSVQAALKSEREFWSSEYRFMAADGHYVDILDRCHIIRDELGTPVRLVGSMIDMTERKRIEDSLQRSEAKYRSLAENMNDVVWTTNVDFVIDYISPSIERVLGYTASERLGHNSSESMTPESQSSTVALIRKFLNEPFKSGSRNDETILFETAHYHKNGSMVWLENLASIVRAVDGRPIEIHGVSRDITDRKRIESERNQLIVQLQSAMADIKTLRGLLPICANCKKIRDDQGYWSNIENYIAKHSEAQFSHGICPECALKLYPEVFSKK